MQFLRVIRSAWTPISSRVIPSVLRPNVSLSVPVLSSSRLFSTSIAPRFQLTPSARVALTRAGLAAATEGGMSRTAVMQRRRLMAIVLGLVVVGGGTMTLLNYFSDNLMFFMTPTMVMEKEPPVSATKLFRLGGLVKEGSVERSPEHLNIKFIIHDMSFDIPVEYTGILPDLFREGQSVVAEGRLVDGIFKADQILAKHDENYMPPEVAEIVNQKKAAEALNPIEGQVTQSK